MEDSGSGMGTLTKEIKSCGSKLQRCSKMSMIWLSKILRTPFFSKLSRARRQLKFNLLLIMIIMKEFRIKRSSLEKTVKNMKKNKRLKTKRESSWKASDHQIIGISLKMELKKQKFLTS